MGTFVDDRLIPQDSHGIGAEHPKMVRAGILCASLGHIPNSFLLPTHQLLEGAAGRNTGNLAFRYAVDQHIASTKVHVPWGADPAWVRERCDLLVIPSSNQANPATDLAHRADFLEAVNLPCLALGLGAQAPSEGADITLSRGTLRYLRALSERSRLIGVRGEYTARVLARVGVKNTMVVGCPSHFINPLPTLGATLEQKLRRGVFPRLVLTDVELKPSQRRLSRKLFGWLLTHRGAYVCQSHACLIALARNRPEETTTTQVDAFRRFLQAPAARLRPRSKFLKLARQRFRVFFDTSAWLEFLSSFDLSIGVRFHGSILAVQAGTPGICIYHDARTHELCQTTATPHASTAVVESARNINDLVQSTAFDGKRFDERRGALAREYHRLLMDSGVTASHALAQLTEIRSL